jgi:hypothetical protein
LEHGMLYRVVNRKELPGVMATLLGLFDRTPSNLSQLVIHPIADKTRIYLSQNRPAQVEKLFNAS